jgi:hypothetical protein
MDPVFIIRWGGCEEIPTMLGPFLGLDLGPGYKIALPKVPTA